MRPALRAAVAPAVLALVLTGCTSDGNDVPEATGPPVPAEADFTEGTCRIAAPDVRAVGEAIPRLGTGGEVDDDVKDLLRTSQERLGTLGDGAEPALKPALDDLVQKIGIVRIRADGNTYEPALGEFLTTSYEQLVAACTGDGAAG